VSTMVHRLLIVDDHPDEVEFLRRELVKAGHEVDVADNARGFSEYYLKWSAVILDQNLGPGKETGDRIARRILRKTPDYPVFGYVARTPNHDMTVAGMYDAGCRGIWVKENGEDPRSLEELIIRIGLSLCSSDAYLDVLRYINGMDIMSFAEARSFRSYLVPLEEALWGKGTDRLRENIASNFCGEAQALLDEAKQKSFARALALLQKALILNPDCLQALYLLAGGIEQGRFDSLKDDDTSWAMFLERSLEPIRLDFPDEAKKHLAELSAKPLREDPCPEDDSLLVCCFGEGLGHVDYLAFQNIQLEGSQTPRLQKYLGRLHNPRLMLPIKQLAAMPSREYSVLDDLVKQGKDHRVIRHRGLVIRAAAGVFGPAIDTLWFNEMLHRHLYTNPGFAPACVCEVGCGSGMLLCSLVQRYASSLKQIVAIDTSAKALALAEENLRNVISKSRSGAELSLIQGECVLEILRDRSIDVLVTNPPYLPPREQATPGGGSPVFGAEIVQDLTRGRGAEVLSPGGLALVLRSSLTQDADLWENVPPGDWLIDDLPGGPLRVPLDLREVAGDPQWEWVNRGSVSRGLFVNPSHPYYQHWHDLSIRRLRRR
jgi:methylase of polypeptide subunit release factors